MSLWSGVKQYPCIIILKEDMSTNKLYELWWRYPYRRLLQKQLVTLAIRPGDRRLPNPKGTREGDIINLRILLKPGDEEPNLCRLPKLDNFLTSAKISKITVKKWSEVADKDLLGASPDCLTKEGAWYNLGLIYNKEIADNDLVSLIRFEYI